MTQEYGADCPFPNTNTAYISYLDSNQLYHCPTCGAHHDTGACTTFRCPCSSSPPSKCGTSFELLALISSDCAARATRTQSGPTAGPRMPRMSAPRRLPAKQVRRPCLTAAAPCGESLLQL